MFKWFWTIFSLGAPDVLSIKTDHLSFFKDKNKGYMWSSRSNSILQFLERKGESFGCSDFWDHLGGQTLVMIGRWY